MCPIFVIIIIQRNLQKISYGNAHKSSKTKISVWNNLSWLSIQYWRTTSIRRNRFACDFFPKITLFTEEMTPVRYIEYFILYLGLFICGLATGIILIAGLLRLNQVRDNFISFYQLFDNQKSWRRSNKTY